MVTKTTQQGVRGYFHRQTIDGDDGRVTLDVYGKTAKTWSDTFTGSDNPNWRKTIARGGNATTSASGSKRSERLPRASGSISVSKQENPLNPYTGIYSGEVSGSPSASAALFDYTKADAAARLKFIDNYRSTRQAFSSGTFLGELRETLHMIRHPALSLRRGIDRYGMAVKKRLTRTKRYADRLKVVQDTWLEYNFGWAPFVHDITDAYNELVTGRSFWLEPVKGFSKFTDRSGGQYITNLLGTLNCRIDYQSTTETSVRYLGAVRADRHSPPSLMDAWGFRPEDFLPTVWELIPYSFLVDYFTNIGDIISAMSEGPVSLAWGCKTSRGERKLTQTGGYLFKTAGTIGTVKGSCSGFQSTYTTFARVSVSNVSVGVSDFGFKLPEFQSKKWLNIGALAQLRR